MEVESFLTMGDVVKLLRLDQKNVKNPSDSLKYLIRTRQIEPVKICGQNLFTKEAIQKYVDRCAKGKSA